MRRLRRKIKQDAELDITSFMNLMIVLVPVLLLSLVFSQVRILNLQLPVNSEPQENTELNDAPKVLELIVNAEGFVINYPSGVLLTELNKQHGEYPYLQLSKYLQDLKLTFQQQGIEKSDILLLLAEDTEYQTIVSTMDTVRSFKAVVAANLVDAELFPNISLGDAPE
ncbi:biopolymer transporter ExbD [Catenovulum sediminis]|uniref:Biopolymer transporter ExbD n=1 Tax=Catenovulum sediminis TaxID=1740262 RepID=A0ABV1RLY4_9ALTE